jgi:hypothetical protein
MGCICDRSNPALSLFQALDEPRRFSASSNVTPAFSASVTPVTRRLWKSPTLATRVTLLHQVMM